jgi:hypothetical protein
MARNSQLVFLFPSDYFNPKKPDQAFTDQAQALKQLGFKIAVLSLETATIFPTLQMTYFCGSSSLLVQCVKLKNERYQHHQAALNRSLTLLTSRAT